MYDISGFYEWLNELTDEVYEESNRLNIDTWEVAGLRPDAPQSAKDAYKKYLEDMAYAREHGIKY
jgi:hypothetical protein